MQVQNWMSKDVVTVDEQTPIIEVMHLLEEHDIRHIPVTKEGKLVGMITDRDVKEASPSKATSLKAQELYYLLAEMKAKDVMKADPIVISPDQTMEVAAVKMLEHKVTGIPVVTRAGDLIGIISQGDVFRVLISITGIYQGGVQFAFNLEDRSGTIKEVANVLREEDAQIVSILSCIDTADEGYRHVFIRIKKIPEEKLQRMIIRLEQDFMLLYVIKDPLQEI
ncbi:MAG: CBS domain-containing protein [Deltaproteobacteria bacterium]|nr:CBS domain-containing protein [Deltaproteobacteria bacterium]